MTAEELKKQLEARQRLFNGLLQIMNFPGAFVVYIIRLVQHGYGRQCIPSSISFPAAHAFGLKTVVLVVDLVMLSAMGAMKFHTFPEI